MTVAGLGYVLLVKRKPLLALWVLTLVATGLTVFSFSKSMGIRIKTEGSTLTIELPGQTVHYIPIHSQLGWQNTSIELKAGQEVKYTIAGSVSPGYLQDIDLRIQELRKYKQGGNAFPPEPMWPFTGPEGYPDTWYKDMKHQDEKECDYAYQQDNKAAPEKFEAKRLEGLGHRNNEMRISLWSYSALNFTSSANNKEKNDECKKRVTKHFVEDNGLTVKGIAHNRVVGIILPRGVEPYNSHMGEPGYNYNNQNDKEKLILFEKTNPKPEEWQKMTPKEGGILWIVINDAEPFRWDNAGLYFMQLAIP